MFPDTVDFGGIPLGGNYFGKLVYFENDTGGPIEINSPYIGGQAGNPFAWFSNLIGRFGLGDGRALSYGVRFHPPGVGLFEDDLCIPVTDQPHPCVHLQGYGIETLSAEVFRRETASLTTYVPNPGYLPLDVRIRTGQSWATPLPSFAVIAPGDSLEVTIALNASELEPGAYRDSMRLSADAI